MPISNTKQFDALGGGISKLKHRDYKFFRFHNVDDTRTVAVCKTFMVMASWSLLYALGGKL